MNVQKLNGILRIFDSIEHDFSSNTKGKNYFLCTCIVLDQNINSKEMEQKFSFEGLIGYGNSCMDLFLLIQNFSDFMQFYKKQLDL